MFTRILTCALFAGAAAGLVASVLQLVFIQPVLLEAEVFEAGAHAHSHGTAEGHGDAGLATARSLLTVAFTVLLHCGYALMLLAAMAAAEWRGARISLRAGLVWGIAGFAAVQLAPGFSLPPEVPGAASADLGARQIWWWCTAAATIVALWLVAFGRGWAAWGAAVALLLSPHLVGAPTPTGGGSGAPAELGSLFAARSLGVGAAAWAILGASCGHFWLREGERMGVTRIA